MLAGSCVLSSYQACEQQLKHRFPFDPFFCKSMVRGEWALDFELSKVSQSTSPEYPICPDLVDLQASDQICNLWGQGGQLRILIWVICTHACTTTPLPPRVVLTCEFHGTQHLYEEEELAIKQDQNGHLHSQVKSLQQVAFKKIQKVSSSSLLSLQKYQSALFLIVAMPWLPAFRRIVVTYGIEKQTLKMAAP